MKALIFMLAALLLLTACSGTPEQSQLNSNVDGSISKSTIPDTSAAQPSDALLTGGDWPFIGPELEGKRTPQLDALPEKDFVISDNLSILYLVEDGSQIVVFDPTASTANEVASHINNAFDYNYFELYGLSTRNTLRDIMLYGFEEAVWYYNTITAEFETPDGEMTPYTTTTVTINATDYVGTEYFIESTTDMGGMMLREMRVNGETLTSTDDQFTAFRLLEDSAPGVAEN